MTVHASTPEPQRPVTADTADRRPVPGDPPGWYADPQDPAMMRGWAGRAWAVDGNGDPVRRSSEPSVAFPARVTATYLLGMVVPYVAAVVLPIPVMNLAAPPNGVGSLAAWQHAMTMGVLTGWALWIVGLVVWRAAEHLFAEEATTSYDAAAAWHRTGLVLTIVVAVLGALGTVGVFLVLAFTAALGGVGNGL